MNPLVAVGGAVLVLGLIVLIVAVLRRPTGSSDQLTVAALQARLAEEDAPSAEQDERLLAPEMEHAAAPRPTESGAADS
ncbi:hypothetical protein DFR70_102513 [Nocardia tenerifensis]|uniref:Uncharacterized protein n=1 Tax=Nocardia tenerifensis TaxID=228006 RepID=A0A318KKA6_9NOCA|nr:hypothetical protein [Nocardia tenerifensis]PXX68827.1 hypothetical protein DFR70_102513 [Nocardia tenerifensis]